MIVELNIVSRITWLIRFYRIKEWIHILGLCILGYLYVGDIPLDLEYLGFSLILTALYLSFGYSSNTIFEGYNGFKNCFNQLAMSFFPAIIGLYLALHHSTVLTLIFSTGIILSLAYSGPPFFLKGLPIIELIINSILFMIVFLIGVSVSTNNFSYDVYLMSLFVFLMVIPFQLIQELKDKEHDVSLDLVTTAIHLTPIYQKTLVLISVLSSVTLSIFISVYHSQPLLFPLITLLYSVFLIRLILSFDRGDIIDYVSYHRLFRYSAIVYGLCLTLIFF